MCIIYCFGLLIGFVVELTSCMFVWWDVVFSIDFDMVTCLQNSSIERKYI